MSDKYDKDVNCYFCNVIATSTFLGDKYNVACPRCGLFYISTAALGSLPARHLSQRQKANISGWIMDNQRVTISSSALDELVTLRTPSYTWRADRLLKAICRETVVFGQEVCAREDWISYCWCANIHEMMHIMQYLIDVDRVAVHKSPGRHDRYHVLSGGWLHAEKLESVSNESVQAFVAMWFDEAMNIVYENAISMAIYGAGFLPHRVDKREHNNKIDDEIIAEIRKSKFVVADFTGHRGGVYFEAGFAKGLGIEVFWTCREDELEELHFDVRQYNCIPWRADALEDFRERLRLRIESVLGRGPIKD